MAASRSDSNLDRRMKAQDLPAIETDPPRKQVRLWDAEIELVRRQRVPQPSMQCEHHLWQPTRESTLEMSMNNFIFEIGSAQLRIAEAINGIDKTLAQLAQRRQERREPPRTGHTPRLSMPEVSSDSDSEPDLSVLAMARGGSMPTTSVDLTPSVDPYYRQPEQQLRASEAEEVMSPEQYEPEDTSVEEQVEEEVETEEEVEDGEEEEEEEEEEHEDGVPLADPAAAGLKEISNLGKFTVSSHKQGNGVEELRNDDTKAYWQSDGPQPHKLTVYFVKRVGIRDIRFYVNYNEDESYTPTKIVFKSGTSENNLIEFASMSLESPVGWQQVPIAGAGGDPDGNTLVSYVLQMQILENHQNGKDTHLRGIKIYAFDNDSPQGAAAAAAAAAAVDGSAAEAAARKAAMEEEATERALAGSAAAKQRLSLSEVARTLAVTRLDQGAEGLTIPDYMREPELR